MLEFPPSPGVVDEAGLRDFGRALGAALHAPVIVALHGDLGAGKTTLAQAIAAGAGVEEEVTSPTFALVHQYQGARVPVFHIDLYRLKGPADLTNVGWDEIVGGDGIVLIEWPERAEHRLPGNRLDVTLRDAGPDATRRSVEVAWTN